MVVGSSPVAKLVGLSKKKKKKIDATGNVTDAGNNDYSRIKHW